MLSDAAWLQPVSRPRFFFFVFEWRATRLEWPVQSTRVACMRYKSCSFWLQFSRVAPHDARICFCGTQCLISQLKKLPFKYSAYLMIWRCREDDMRLIVVICKFARGKKHLFSYGLSSVTPSPILNSVSRHSPCFSLHPPSASEYPPSGGRVFPLKFDD